MRITALLLIASPLLAQHGPPPGHPGASQHVMDGVYRGPAPKPEPTGQPITLVTTGGSRVELKPLPIVDEKSFSWFGVASVQRWIQVPEALPLAAPQHIEFGRVDPTKGSNTVLVKLLPDQARWTAKLKVSFGLSSRPRDGFEPLPGRKLPAPEVDAQKAYCLTLPEPLPPGTYALVSQVEAWVFRVGEPAALGATPQAH